MPVITSLAEFLSGVLAVAFEGISVVVETLVGWITTAVEWVADLWQKFQDLGGLSSVWDNIVAGFKSMVNSIIGAWNSLDFSLGPYSIPSWVPFAGGKEFGIADIFPDIPLLAEGGIVQDPTLAVVGEAGPEAVVPLSEAGLTAAAGGAFGGVSVTVNIMVDSPTVRSDQDLDDLVLRIEEAVRKRALVDARLKRVFAVS